MLLPSGVFLCLPCHAAAKHGLSTRCSNPGLPGMYRGTVHAAAKTGRNRSGENGLEHSGALVWGLHHCKNISGELNFWDTLYESIHIFI